MKTFLFIVTLAVSAVAGDRPTVAVGRFWGGGASFTDAKATLLDSNRVRFEESRPVPAQALGRGGSKPGSARPVTLFWEQTPQAVRAKLADARQAMLAAESRKEADASAGIRELKGTVLGRTPEGFLAQSSGQVIHVIGATDLADGERFSTRVIEKGLYQYTSVAGALATVRQYRLAP